VIGELSVRAQKIGSITALIQDIASRSGRLGLNATIEATRTGEAGKGFAFVTSEVKSLARHTARGAEEISGVIQDIRAATELQWKPSVWSLS
jgi:methyl-accepting chemotaxis protein